MPEIHSVQNPRIKAAVRLRDGRHRRKQGRFLIDGLREVERAVEAGFELLEVFCCAERGTAEQQRDLDAFRINFADEVVEEPFDVTAEVFDKLAFGARAEGIVAVARMPEFGLEDITLGVCPLVAVVEGIEKPGNVGAVVRSADGAGLDAVVLADGRTDLFNPNAIRASLGTIFSRPVCEATSEETLAWLRAQGLAIIAARVDGAVPYTQIDFCRPTALILGSEAEGLTRLWSADDITAVSLPMLGAADSLNISATAAVLFYEALRQRSGG
ncbi:MAG: RNA methyltransferase [Pirellulales bacterium]|nr:RNA methyltransferase [Pirellulales bacterium]